MSSCGVSKIIKIAIEVLKRCAVNHTSRNSMSRNGRRLFSVQARSAFHRRLEELFKAANCTKSLQKFTPQILMKHRPKLLKDIAIKFLAIYFHKLSSASIPFEDYYLALSWLKAANAFLEPSEEKLIIP